MTPEQVAKALEEARSPERKYNTLANALLAEYERAERLANELADEKIVSRALLAKHEKLQDTAERLDVWAVSDEKRFTEREMVAAKRAAYLAGKCSESPHVKPENRLSEANTPRWMTTTRPRSIPEDWLREADTRYPMPKGPTMAELPAALRKALDAEIADNWDEREVMPYEKADRARAMAAALRWAHRTHGVSHFDCDYCVAIAALEQEATP